MKSDNSKIKLAWELRESGVVSAIDRALDVTEVRHPAIHRVLWDGRRDLRPHVEALGSSGSEESRYAYKLNADSVVIDAGGFHGDWAAAIRAKYGCGVIVLEPVKAFYNQIVKRFAGIPQVKVYNFGLGGTTGTIEFGIQHDSTGRFSGSAERETVRIEAVDEVLNAIGKDIDLLKLNIEGAEFDVVDKLLDTGLISRVKDIQVQWHQVIPDCVKRYEAIQERLEETHYLTFYAGWVWQNWRRT